jgi:lipid II:glycine glycyltransferase (peptidoglycan interpeptide bridge formation enzyme)
MTIEIKIAKEKDKEEWDSHGTIFHTWKWLKIVEKHTNTKLYPLIGLKGTVPVGVFPLFYKKKNFIKILFSPPPKALLTYLGPIIVEYDKLKKSKRESTFVEFQKRTEEFISKQLKYNCARIRSPPDLLDSRPFKWAGYDVEPFYTYMINLKGGADHVWSEFNKQLRIDINKTKKKGVVVKEDSKKGLEFLCDAVARRFEEQGMGSSKFYKKYLFDIYNAFHPENFKIFIARYKGKRVGGLTLLCYKNKAYLWMGIPKTDIKGISPNDMATWESIKWACENGFDKYEIMGAGYNPRLRHFKSKFNPKLSLWFSAIKYSPSIYGGLEKAVRIIYGKLKLGRLT